MGLRVGGLASGLDTSALIDAMMSLERRPLLLAQARKADIEEKRDLFGELDTKLSAFRDAAAAIDNLNSGLSGPTLDEEFLAYTATSSDESVITATASTGATPGTTSIVVDALATTARHASNSFASDTAVVASRRSTIDITHGGPAPISITVGAAGASLRDLKDLINTDPNNAGEVRAEVIFDGTGHRLVISGTSTGASNDVVVAARLRGSGGGAFLDPLASASAADAQLTVFGLAVTRDSNSITDLVPGVALELTSAAPGVPIQVQVSRDDEEIELRIQTFADAYNDIIGFLNDNARYSAESEDAGALLGDATIRSVESQVRRVVVDGYSFAGNPFGSLAQIGLRLQDDGTLSLDSDTLKSALSTDASAVRELLSGTGSGASFVPGASTAISQVIDPLLDPDKTRGAFAIRAVGFADRISTLDQQIERLETRLEKREELLVLRFTQLETQLVRLQSQGSSLSALSQSNGS